MSLEISIKDNCTGLRSDRATERKKNAEALCAYINSNAAPVLLSENTIKKTGFNWNNLFDDVNEFLLKECEKFETSRSFHNIKLICSNLLHSAISRSNSDKAYIKTSKITEASLFILKSNRLINAFGDTFLNVLYKHILPNDHHLDFISPDTWRDLLETCTSIYYSSESLIDAFTHLRLLMLIIQCAVARCQCGNFLVLLLSEFENCYKITTTDKKIQETLIEIALSLSEQLASEYRLTTCQFIENVLPKVTRWYDQNADLRKKEMLFKFLLISVKVHHPQGRLQNEEGSLALNWMMWNKQLQTILEIISLEINYLQKVTYSKFKMQNDNPSTKTCSSFVHLAACVYYLIFNETEIVDEEVASTSSKRPRLMHNNFKTFNDLIDCLQEHHMPLIGILHNYITNYGHAVSVENYYKILNILESDITNNDINFNWDDYRNLIIFTLENLTLRTNLREEPVIVSLWNSCVRYSTSVNAAHETHHNVICTILNLDLLDSKHIMSLSKLYEEKAMPVTDSSLSTLNVILKKHFGKYSDSHERAKCFLWLISGDYKELKEILVKQLLCRIISKENYINEDPCECGYTYDDLYDILFKSVEKSILFSTFELEVKETPEEKVDSKCNPFEAESELQMTVVDHFNKDLEELVRKFKNKEGNAVDIIKQATLILTYCDILLKNNIVTTDYLQDLKIYKDCKNSIKFVLLYLEDILRRGDELNLKVELLKKLQKIMKNGYHIFLKQQIRLCLRVSLFHKLEEIINDNYSFYDEVQDIDLKYPDNGTNSLKSNCVLFLTSYCREDVDYRNEVLNLVLNPALYNFKKRSDLSIIFKCFELLNDIAIQTPIEPMFKLLGVMCKELFRNAKTTFRILENLYKMLDTIMSNSSETTRDNCLMMIKGYLSRCEKSYYPPEVAALVYRSMAKIDARTVHLATVDAPFKDAFLHSLNNNGHGLRLYCCYLCVRNLTAIDCVLKSDLAILINLFIIDILDRNPLILKDELANRTATVFYCLLTITSYRPSFTLDVVNYILELHKIKKLNQATVSKVLHKIAKKTTNKSLKQYLNDKLLYITHFWLGKGHKIQELPIVFFGFNNIDEFVNSNMHILVPAELLWSQKGNINNTELIKKINKPLEEILEQCFPNIIALCLPHIACVKFNTAIIAMNSQFRDDSHSSQNLFQACRHMLSSDKWSSLFIENIAQFVILTVSELYDSRDIKQKFNVNIVPLSSFHISLDVFESILKYIGEIIDSNLMQFLGNKLPLAMVKIMIKLWTCVTEEIVYEYKVLELHRFLVIFERNPLTTSSDAFVCNFACNSLMFAIKQSKDKKEILVFAKALHIVLGKLLPQKLEVIQKLMPKIMSTLIIKNEEGYGEDCMSLLNYLLIEMKSHLKECIDLVDGTQNMIEYQFTMDKSLSDCLKVFISKLNHYSFETICKLKTFLKCNREYIFDTCKELDCIKGFSEDCSSSLIHQLINALINIVQSSADTQIVLESCNCLAEVGPCDLNTLVMMTPKDAKKVVNVVPNQYFGLVVIMSLSKVIYDENPIVVNLGVNALTALLKYRDGQIAMDFGEVNKCIFQPFTPTSEVMGYAKFKINGNWFDEDNIVSFWELDGEDDYLDWLKKLTILFLKTVVSEENYLLPILTICNAKPIICEDLLPPLIGLVIYFSSPDQINKISIIINKFFHNFLEKFIYWDDDVSDETMQKRNKAVLTHKHKLMAKCVLEVVDFVRLQSIHYKKWSSKRELYNYLKLDYKAVAWAANVADRSVSAIYYGELWCIMNNNGVPALLEESSEFQYQETIEKILRKAFISIGDTDAVEGCGTSHLINEDERRKHLMRSGHFIDSLLAHDVSLTLASNSKTDINELQHGIVQSLHQSGLYHTAMQYIKLLPDNDRIDEVKFDCCLQLGDWNIFVDTSELEAKSKSPNVNLESITKAFRYACLKDCLTRQTIQDDKFKLPLQQAKTVVSMLCQKLNMDNCQNVYKVAAELQLLKEIEDYYLVRCDKASLTDLLYNWQVKKLSTFHDNKYLDMLLSQRSLILEHAAAMDKYSINDVYCLQLDYAELLLDNEKSYISQRLVAIAKKLEHTDKVTLVESKVAWAQGHKDIALSLIRRVTLEPSANRTLNAAAFWQYGNWMVELKYESAKEVIDKYLLHSLEELGPNGHVDTRLKVYFDIAKYADAEYKQVVSYMKSSSFMNKIRCMENMRDNSTNMNNAQNMTMDERKALCTNKRLSKLDEAEIDSTHAEKKRFLCLAMKYYLLSLREGEETDLSVFRVISLWVENPTIVFESTTDDVFSEFLNAVPSRKFLPVLPQLAPRMTNEDTMFAENLNFILGKCATDHPHHTLPILFGLMNSHKDLCIMNLSSMSSVSSLPRGQVEEPRVVAARNLVAKLEEADDSLAVIIKQMNLMCNAIISFAHFNAKTKQIRQNIPRSEPLGKLRNLNAISVPTVTLPVKKDCIYSDIVSIASFADSFDLVGGINCPKKMTCKGSDGENRIILIKGEDDMRQDAVMQQVFTIVNTLLKTNAVTSKYKLLIRTYKVVPMSRRSGVLEWCEGTVPLGQYLVGTPKSPGAHSRYRPLDISCSVAREKLTACHMKPVSVKLKVFTDILKEFKPVFHFFFTEHYLNPVSWYERQKAYIKSVATSSMVGYILGLGDRHVQNILIDKKTAEVIHIDFGIAFDLGKALPTPESVPFRLTQDIIAGFGPCGIEGTFRRCCERTMQLLRDNQETLLTILEVLLCDPLYSWSMTRTQSKRKQSSTVASNNDVERCSGMGGPAERALLAVRSKLGGTEGGAACGVRVPGQVTRLLRHATDTDNLCRLFPGWQPYL